MNLPDDPILMELLPEFIDDWMIEIENFNIYESNGQTVELYRMGHTLKGSCYQFGLRDLGDIGLEMMNCSKNSDWKEARNLYYKVKQRLIEIDDYMIHNNLV